MFARALLAFLALPGIVAFLVPAWIAADLPLRLNVPGAALFVLGVTILLWTVVSFYFEGRGTLAPWSPPRHLVTGGLYRVSRNPMYIGVLCILAGWALLYGSALLGGYAVAVALLFHLRVVFGEEPWQARTFGAEWQAYERSVPRWLFRLRPGRP